MASPLHTIRVVRHDHVPTLRHSPPCAGASRLGTGEAANLNLYRMNQRRKYHMWPQIVPPVYEKGDLIGTNFVRLWRQAAETLGSADWITFVGYSHPASDVHAANLIKRAMARNTTLARLDIVNPDPSVLVRVTSLVSVPSLTWYRSLETYVPAV